MRYFIPSREASILELGSGLGEVVIALEDSCKKIFALETDHTLFSALNADINSRVDHPIIAIPSMLSELNLKEEIKDSHVSTIKRVVNAKNDQNRMKPSYHITIEIFEAIIS